MICTKFSFFLERMGASLAIPSSCFIFCLAGLLWKLANFAVREQTGPQPMMAAISMAIKNGVISWHAMDMDAAENSKPVNILPIKVSAKPKLSDRKMTNPTMTISIV